MPVNCVIANYFFNGMLSLMLCQEGKEGMKMRQKPLNNAIDLGLNNYCYIMILLHLCFQCLAGQD